MSKKKLNHTILFGNGLNRISPDCHSWSSLLEIVGDSSSVDADFGKIPFTFQYEVLLPKDYYCQRDVISGNGSKFKCAGISEAEIRKNIGAAMLGVKTNDLYRRLANLDAGNYLTTNYEYLLQDAFTAQGCTHRADNPERVYSIRRHTDILKGDDRICKIWHIHGEARKPDSLTLGYAQYGGSLAKVDSYIKSTYYRDKFHRDSIEQRLLEKRLDDNLSWIDLLYYTDVHIFGIGLDYSEADLWYVLNLRARLFKKLKGEAEPNPITYYGNLSPDKIHLLRGYGVSYVEVAVADNDYRTQYNTILDMIEEKAGQRKFA